MDTVDTINKVVSIAVFGLVFSVWCICIFLWLGRYLVRLKIVQRRLGVVADDSGESRTLRLWREIYRRGDSPKFPGKPSWKERLERFGHDGGWHIPAQTVLLGVIGATGLAFAITYISGGGILLAVGVSALVVFAFWGYAQRRISKLAVVFERQFLDALSIAARALRAGHPLVGSFQLASEEISEPLGPMFYQICQEQSMGMDLKDSLRRMAKTTSNREFRLFATAVAIQLGTGGNLADLMDSLSSVIRQRMTLNRRLRVVTAQIRLSKKVLIGLPILLFFLLSIISPDYMEPLYTTSVGKWMLGFACVSVFLGSWVMARLSVLRF